MAIQRARAVLEDGKSLPPPMGMPVVSTERSTPRRVVASVERCADSARNVVHLPPTRLSTLLPARPAISVSTMR